MKYLRRILLSLALMAIAITLTIVASARPAQAAPAQSVPGVVTGSTAWALRDTLTSGAATTTFSYGTRPLVPVMGDWDGDGSKTAGTYEKGVFRLRNSNAGGTPDMVITFGNPGGFPVIGDFDNNGTDDLAVFRLGVWQIRFLGPGAPADISFNFGPAANWPAVVPVAGNWDGLAGDGIGTYNISTAPAGQWNLRQTAGAGAADAGTFTYNPGTSPYPVVGDWDGNGTDTVGVKDRSATGNWQLNNANDGGLADTIITFGVANDLPVVWVPLNDPPVNNLPPDPVVNEDEVLTLSGAGAISVSDPDAGPDDVKVTLTSTNGLMSLSGTAGLAFTTGDGSADATMTFTGTIAAINTALNGMTFSPVKDYFGAASIQIITDDQGNNGGGGPKTDTDTLNITVTAVNDPPVGVSDSFDALGNTRLVVGATTAGPHISLTGDVRSNDTDVDTPTANFTTTAETVSSSNCPACSNVVIGTNGSFTYDPPAGFTGADTFAYEVNDNDTGDPPSPAQTGTGTVTINVQGPVVWYVDSTPEAGQTGNTGRSHSPFTSIASLQPTDGSVDDVNEIIFIYSGTYAAAGGLPLQTGQRLLGEPFGLTIDPNGSLPQQNLVPAGGANPVLQTTTANTAAITLANGAEILRVNVSSSTCSGCAGIRGTGVTTATIGTGTQISNNSGGGIVLTGAAAGNINVGSQISGNGGLAVNIQNRSGGAVSFSGALSGMSSAGGVSLASNGGGTIVFSGGLDFSTGAGSAFSATGGGTVTATQNNSSIVNKLTTTTGRALNVDGVNIGAAGLTFRSISAKGAANGIVLSNTGTAAGLSVTGTGAAGTGGTIQDTTADGISLTNTRNVSLSWMTIGNTARNGINGTRVTNFSFTNGAISGSGTSVAEDSNIAFNDNPAPVDTTNNLSGTVTITGNTLTTAFYHGVDIFNWAGTISNATISNNTITSTTSAATSKGFGIRFIASGSASAAAGVTQATIDNNVITNFPGGGGMTVQANNAVSTTAPVASMGVFNHTIDKVSITNNKIAGQSMANPINGEAIVALANGRAQANFNISNNGTAALPLRFMKGIAISSSSFGLAQVSLTASGNVIDAQSQIFGAQGIGVGLGTTFAASDTPRMDVTISGNDISRTDGNGILAVARDTNGTLNAKIQNNTVDAPLGGVREGIRIDSGNAGGTGENDTVCLNISGNTSAGNQTSSPGGPWGIGLRKQGTVANQFTFGIHGLPSSPAGTPTVENYVNSQNPAGGNTLLISAESGFTSCSLP